jgi:4-carboxymuconolactone decarboxylase
MTRLPHLRPDDLTHEQRHVYDVIAGGSRAAGPQLFPLTDSEGRLAGPFNAMLHHPAIGDALQHLGATIRYRGTLSPRSREIAILAVAAHWQCGFEQRAHEAVGRHAGLTPAELDALRTRVDLDLADDEESAVFTTTRALLEHADLDDLGYQRTVTVLDSAKLVELTTLVGYYSLLALQMRVFRVA